LLGCFAGFPGSGKSSYFHHHFEPQGYAHINRDTLKTPAKCLSAARDALTKHQSCVIDNTNPSREARSSFIALAKELGVPVRCMYFDVSRHAAEHMNDFRALMGISEAVPTMAYNMFVSKFEAPSKSEGFVSVINYQFQPHFENDRQRRLFMHFL
jgi:bifunctional polynucleotide phosphatase/kinase